MNGTEETLSPDRRMLLELMRQRQFGTPGPMQLRPRRLDLTEAPLSFAQQRLWILDQLHPGNPAYNIPAAVKIEGRLNIHVLTRAVEEIVRRHEILRTTFRSNGEQPFQIIAESSSVVLPVVDLNGAEDEAERLVKQLARQPFDLACGPLVRITLLRLSSELHWLVLVVHHIVFDGWSRVIFIRELMTLYEAFVREEPSPFEELPVQYADYAVWQREVLQSDVLAKELDHWKKALGSPVPPLRLLADHPRSAAPALRGAKVTRSLPTKLIRRLEQLACTENATPFVLILAAFKILLWRHTGQRELLVGAPVANREVVDTEQSIGFFINALALRRDLTPRASFREFLKQVRTTVLDALSHQQIPFEKLVEELRLERHSTDAPLFQVAFSIKEAPMKPASCANLKISPIEIDAGAAKLDFALSISESESGHVVMIDYDADLFERASCLLMLEHFENLLGSIVANPETPLTSLFLTTEFDNLCHQRFQRCDPDASAVTFEGQRLTYGELNRRANQVAHYLRARGIGIETPVAVCLKRSLNTTVALLAVLKSGGVYVPLDPFYLGERGAFILKDSRAQIVLTDSDSLPSIPATTAEIVCIDREPALKDQPLTNPPPLAMPDNAAYIIYTSGTTGRPKGVVVEHRGLFNVVAETIAAFKITPKSRVLQFASIAFDASIWQTFMALQAGAELFPASDEDRRSGLSLVTLLQESRADVADLPPSLLAALPPEEIPALRTISTGGERVPGEVSDAWSPRRRFFNVYGPAETSVAVSMMRCDRPFPQGPPIGRAIANIQPYVLDEQLQPVPTNCPGELYVGGVGVARGYLHQPELTAESFVPDPFSAVPGARLYKTGDWVRYLIDGNIEFLGRKDRQIQLRGFRIELNEIEAALQRHPAVEEAAVITSAAHESEQLVAYIVRRSDRDLDERQLHHFVRTQLPEYMVPQTVVVIDQMPRNISGKVDRAALPAIQIQSNRALDMPQTPMAHELTRIWATLLKIKPEEIGVYDSFFKLGGHSLLAIQLLFQIKHTFDVEIPFVELFQNPTVAGLELAIVQAKLEHVKTGELDELLADVESLSDEEIDQLLIANQ